MPLMQGPESGGTDYLHYDWTTGTTWNLVNFPYISEGDPGGWYWENRDNDEETCFPNMFGELEELLMDLNTYLAVRK
jgi:hypothetical protein